MSKTGIIMKRTVTILTLVSIGVFFGILLNTSISGDNIYTQFKKYQDVFNMAYKNYVEDVDVKKLNEAAIKGMLNELDVHSVYIDEEEMKRVNESFSGAFEGIGIEFDMLDDTITVISPIAGGPSEELGILAGDKIVQIDGEDAVGIPRMEVPKKLKGPKGTKVIVDIKRFGVDKLINFEITRDKIPIETVDAYYMIDTTDIGYVRINRFAQNTHSEMMNAVFKLKQQGMKKLLLDLRGNPGGYLTQAFYMADEFLKGGDTIVYTKGRRPEFNESFTATNGGALEDIPLIVMINEGSASASEIVSGSIQDLDRGLVVGETSYGKGLVQRQYPLSDGSAFRLTISYYYTPSGRSIQRPFKDKDAYRNLVGRIELEEGLNIEHAIDAIKRKELDSDSAEEEKIDMDSIPIFYTRSGRTVLGGGGITPDYIVKADTSKLTDLVANFRRNRVIYDVVYNYINSDEGKSIKKKYQSDFPKFKREFNLNGTIEKLIRDASERKEIEWNEDEYETDKKYVNLYIKSTIAKLFWDRNKELEVLSEIDRQLTVAKGLFKEAIKISSLK